MSFKVLTLRALTFRSFVACLLATSGIIFIYSALYNPETPYLLPLPGAQWIDCDLPILLATYTPGTVTSEYRKSFSLTASPIKAAVEFRAMKDAYAFLDGKPLIGPTQAPRLWKKTRQADLTGRLAPGKHELYFVVVNDNGPPLLAVSCRGLDCSTGPSWESRCDSKTWVPVRMADDPRVAAISRQFPSAALAFLHQLPLLLGIFIGTFLFMRASRARGGLATFKAWLMPSRVRWLLILFLAGMGINNIARISPSFGYETATHLDYIRFILDRHRIPLPADGWQMFQAPLYYFLSAPLYALLRHWQGDDDCVRFLRIVALLSLLALVELCYRALRQIFPDRNDLQTAGLLIGSLLPMNLYICQFIGNEPLSAALTAATIVYGMSLLTRPQAADKKIFFFAGMLLGAALLAKTSAFALFPPFCWLIAHVSAERFSKRPIVTACANTAIFGAGATSVAGWYYARNWLLLGKPVINGWVKSGGDWWQEPGYRIFGHFHAFGESLRHPIYAGLSGYWDALYSTFWLDGFLTGKISYSGRPPWNYWPMISLTWLSLLPTLALAAGTGRALCCARADLRLRFAAACCLTYFLALGWLYLQVGNYSVGKASYLCGLTPALAVLAADGFDLLSRRRLARDAVWAGLACWTISASLAFYVR